ncbi:hypothetical protein JCM10213_003071 [Rhodosporidiobolus nylandii]
MASLEERLQAASTFLLQSPPGEVNDVFSDIRTIVASDSDLEVGILPALKQYNKEQFTVVQLEDGKKALLTPVSLLPAELGGKESEDGTERHVDPRGQRSFEVDHMKVSTTFLLPLPVDAETESLRSSLDKLFDAYVQNHYSDAVSAVYALEDPAYPPEPATEPAAAPVEAEAEAAEHGIGQTGSLAEDVEGSKEDVADSAADTAEAAESAVPADEGETAQGSTAAAAEASETRAEGEGEGEDKMEVSTPAPAPAAEQLEEEAEAEKKVEEPEAAVEPTPAVEEKKEPRARPSRLFGLYFVGNKYNPANYWTGRWRATYNLDYEKGTLEGTAKIQVHYYEQGNVQLTTTLRSTSPLSPHPSAEAVIAALKSSESSFQRQLSSTYGDMAEEGFKDLRRALPKTKSKVNWEAVGGMRIGKAIGGQ